MEIKLITSFMLSILVFFCALTLSLAAHVYDDNSVKIQTTGVSINKAQRQTVQNQENKETQNDEFNPLIAQIKKETTNNNLLREVPDNEADLSINYASVIPIINPFDSTSKEKNDVSLNTQNNDSNAQQNNITNLMRLSSFNRELLNANTDILFQGRLKKFEQSKIEMIDARRLQKRSILSPKEIAKAVMKIEGNEMKETMAKIDHSFESEVEIQYDRFSWFAQIFWADWCISKTWLVIARMYHQSVEKEFPNINIIYPIQNNSSGHEIPKFTDSDVGQIKRKNYEETVSFYVTKIIGCENNLHLYVTQEWLDEEGRYRNGKNIFDANLTALFNLLKILYKVSDDVYIKANIIRICYKFKLSERIAGLKFECGDLFSISDASKIQKSSKNNDSFTDVNA